jgi:hypothetical protein
MADFPVRVFIRWVGGGDFSGPISLSVRGHDNLDRWLLWRTGTSYTVPKEGEFEVPTSDLAVRADTIDPGGRPFPPPPWHRFHAALLVQATPSAPDGSYTFVVRQEAVL